jgi:hypothetical protein
MSRTRAPDPADEAVRSAASRSPDLLSLGVAASACAACPELVAERSQVVVALGLSATRWFLGPTSLGAVRGTTHPVDIGGRSLRVLPTYHPSAALRFGPAGEPRRLLREDLALALSLAAG